MIHIITKREIWGEAEDFTDAIEQVEQYPEEFGLEPVVLIDFKTKQTMFLKIKIKAEEY